MARWFRYFCAYCCARLLFDAGRAVLRRPPAPPAKPCAKHGTGLLLTLLLLLVAGPVGLILLGFFLK